MSPADLTTKLNAWRRQHAALGAPAYRITLKPRLECDASGRAMRERNFDNEGHKAKGIPERFWSAAEVEAAIPRLRRENARGYDIYMTPIDDHHHFIVLDDATPATLAEALAAGLQPCLTQASSAENVQAILKIPRHTDRRDEQILANRIMQRINQKWGDPLISGARHAFRVAGFSNRKPGREGAFTRILTSPGGCCTLTTRALQQLRDAAGANPPAARKRPKTPRMTLPEPDPAIVATYIVEAAQIAAWAVSKGYPPDADRVDYRAARGLLQLGHAAPAVAAALLAASPDLATRHPDPRRYALVTVQRAADSLKPT